MMTEMKNYNRAAFVQKAKDMVTDALADPSTDMPDLNAGDTMSIDTTSSSDSDMLDKVKEMATDSMEDSTPSEATDFDAMKDAASKLMPH